MDAYFLHLPSPEGRRLGADPTQISMVRTQGWFIAAIKKALSDARSTCRLNERHGMTIAIRSKALFYTI